MKRALIAGAATVVAMLPLAAFAAVPTFMGSIVQECVLGTPYCQLCDLVRLANRFIDFAVYFSVLAATVMFVYAGILYVTASANQPNIEKAKKVFTSVFVGLIIILAAWLVINIILSVITGKGLTFWSQEAGICTAAGNAAPVRPTLNTNEGTPADQLSEANRRITLAQCNVGVNNENSCPKSSTSGPQTGCTSTAGMKTATTDYLCKQAQACRTSTGKVCDMTLSGGNEVHGEDRIGAAGTHSGGDKADLRTTDSLQAYIANEVAKGNFTKVQNPTFGTEQYVDTKTGAVWTREDAGKPNDHFDVCSQNCNTPSATGS